MVLRTLGTMNETLLIYRDKAAENLASAETLFEQAYYNASVSRAYYAAFQAALTVLLAKGFTLETDHKKVQQMFNGELIHRRKVFSAKLKRYLPDMQNVRNDGDYEPFFVGKSKAAEQLKKSREFCSILFAEMNV